MKKLVIVFIGTIVVILFASAAFAAFVKIDATGTELPDSATDWVAVKDTSTGLVWEKKTVANKGDTYYILPPDLWADPKPPSDDPQYAVNYINSLNNTPGLGGFTDWRIPTIRELATIIDFTKSSPAVNADYFQNMNNASYWTSTDYAKGGYDFGNSVYTSGWAINFADGSDYTIDKTAKIYYIIAVRGTALPSPSFTPDTAQNIVKENNSGLIWQKAPGSATKTWADISAYLDTLSGVHVDNSVECYGWRLPTVQELRSVVNYEESSSSKPSVYSDFTASLANYWTSTENADTTKAWYIGFRYGKTGIAVKTTLSHVWAVVDKSKIVACPSYLKGDMNHDGKVDLLDVISGLKILDGLPATVYTDTDVNSDSKIGHEEVIYALQVTATLRP